jgi:ESX secretion-associated protein EspG
VSTLEFDVLWESERLPAPHVALIVPSPGKTHTERAQLVAGAWESLEGRGLAEGGRAAPDVADRLALLAHPQTSVDAWVWADRQVRALAVRSGRQAMLGVIDRDKVWLIPARDTALAEAAVSVAGDTPAGPGRSVSLPSELVGDADAEAEGDPKAFITALERRGVALSEAQAMAAMLDGIGTRGQFGVERRQRDQRMSRAERVVAFHDTAEGRYLDLVRPSPDGRLWSTVTPGDNQRLAGCVWELLEEV